MKEILLQKQNEVAELTERIKNSAAVIAFKYQGLTVEAFQQLRKDMRSNGCEISVIKNNISRRAAKACGYDEEGEKIAYIVGDLAETIYPDISHLLCEECRSASCSH